MRALVMVAAICAFQMGTGDALAEAQCDQFCTVIKRALLDRTNNFQALKGPTKRRDVTSEVFDSWMANISPPGMWCQVTQYHDKYQIVPGAGLHPKGEPYSQFRCADEEQHEADFKKHAKSVFGAFRQLEPKWKWFKGEGELATTFYWGGSSANELYAIVEIIDFGGSGSSTFEFHSTPISVYTANLKSYTAGEVFASIK